MYLYRAIDQYGQVIDVVVSEKRDLAATRRFLLRALDHGRRPSEVTTDRAAAYPRVIEELFPVACHVTEQYANNAVEADHGRLKARLRPMRGVKRLCSARVISAGHAFVQNLPSRPLRTRIGYRPTASAHSDLHRTRARHLIEAAQRKTRLLPAYATNPPSHSTSCPTSCRFTPRDCGGLRSSWTTVGYWKPQQMIKHFQSLSC